MRTTGELALLAFLASAFVVAGDSPKCKDVAWEKVQGMKPEYTNATKLLHTGVDSQGIVAVCFDKCRSLNCSAFIVDLERSGCFSVVPDGDDFVPEPNVTFYHEICLKGVSESCLKTRYWQVERNLGSILLDSMATVLPHPITRSECYEKCINKENCKSAQFRTSRDLTIGNTIGNCVLLTIERGTKPHAYRASLYRDEYLEYQCHNISKTDYCTYAEHRNMLMPYSDLKIVGLNAKQCEQRCDESNDGFLCQAYGIEYSNSNLSTCFLLSENTIGAGVSSLVPSSNSFYKEREPCIDMSVYCTNSSLTIKLRTTEPFVGRMYANGYSETCGVQGHGENLTKLVLPLPDLSNLNTAVMNCGLTPAYSVNQDNQTRVSIWSLVIVQFNPIIQRMGDQTVRVGCTLNDAEVPEPRNITVQSSFTFTDPNAGLPPVVSRVMNTSTVVPIVTMKILDRYRDIANVTQVGQPLILKIQITPNNGPFDIMARHLVASTDFGDESLLLLDEMGCPVTNFFPALLKDPTDNRSLVGEFNAFKFPNSLNVNFNVIVRFCLETCEPARCSKNYETLSRKKRSADESMATKANVTELHKSSNNNSVDEIKLGASIAVQGTKFNDQNIYPNAQRSKDNSDTSVIIGSDHLESKFCMNASLVLFLLLFLLIIQIILIGSCVLAVRTYRRMAIRAEEDRADILSRHLYGIHGGNFEVSRKVRWADNSGSTLS